MDYKLKAKQLREARSAITPNWIKLQQLAMFQTVMSAATQLYIQQHTSNPRFKSGGVEFNDNMRVIREGETVIQSIKERLQ